MNSNSFAEFWSHHFSKLRLKELDSRYLTSDELTAVIHKYGLNSLKTEVGRSFEGRSIDMLSLGNGRKNILAWSCMHGNETTSLRGWMDLFVVIKQVETGDYFNEILQDYTIHFIPMLNPDGAKRYTRRNAMGLDMNRDARALQTPEMQALVSQVEELSPVLAFNLHDQRNIFAVNNQPATISFLAPSVDAERSVTDLRAQTMHLVGKAATCLQPFLKGGIGRYSDEYYPTAIGEFIQQRGIPTVLIECGSAIEDPLRQEARKANAIILYAMISEFSKTQEPEIQAYNNIPLNQTNQVDILIKGIEISVNNSIFKADLALLAEEVLIDGEYSFSYKINDFGDLQFLIALDTHQWLNTKSFENIKIGALADFEFETDKGQIAFYAGRLYKK